jgi:hypothetical protein
MMSKETILAMLQDGKDADAIAQEFVANLNAAIDEKKIQEEADKKVAEKAARAEELAQDIFSFIHDFYPDFELGGLVDLTKEDTAGFGTAIIEMFDAAAEEMKQLTPFVKSLEALIPADKKDKLDNAVKGDPIADFLKASGLL